jgi:hypothetical protein
MLDRSSLPAALGDVPFKEIKPRISLRECLRRNELKQKYKNVEIINKPDEYREMFKIGITDKYLTKKHKQLLENKDAKAMSKGLDMAYKIQGYYAPVQNVNQNLNISLEDLMLKNLERKDEGLKQQNPGDSGLD